MGDKTAYLTRDIQPILEAIDLGKVTEAINSHFDCSNPAVHGFMREAADLVLLAAYTWLARDLQIFSKSSLKLEQNIRARQRSGTLDLIAQVRDSPDICAPFDKFKGQKIIIDWKTSGRPVDTESWADDYVGSWQPRVYGAFEPDAKLFIYRGLAREKALLRYRKDAPEFAPRTREILLGLHPGLQSEVDMQFKGVAAQRQALVDQELPVWPRHKPESCYAYNTPCAFLQDCENNTMPFAVPAKGQLADLRFSTMIKFQLCPEKYRREILQEEKDKSPFSGPENLVFGGSVHSGIEVLWRLAFENFGEE